MIGFFIERAVYAIVGLIAAINGEVWWAILMAIALWAAMCGTEIKVRSKKDETI